MKHKRNKNKGFTLLELIVGVAVFSLVIIIATGLLAFSFRNQRKSIAIQNVSDNARYLIGFMAKEIRMSEILTGDGQVYTLNLNHSTKGNISYTFTGTQIMRDPDGPGPLSASAINSDEVRVDGRFFIDGKGVDSEQPRVTIMMKVNTASAKPEEQSVINLQTTLSQRTLD